MTLVAIRILLINENLNFAVKMKQALERVGGFEVTPFTAADTALEHLQDRPHDVALVDFNLPGMPTMDIVLRLRAIQPDIAIVLSPDLPEVVAIARDMKLNGVVNIPCTARELIPVIKKAVTQTNDTLPETTESPAMGSDSDTLTMEQSPDSTPSPEFSSLGNVLVHTGGLEADLGVDTLAVDMSDAAYAEGKENAKTIEFVLTGDISALRDRSQSHDIEAAARAAQLHQQLAEEEPPMPTLEESGSVGDLHAEIEDADLEEVAAAIRQDQGWRSGPSEDHEIESPGSSPARLILESTMEDTAAAGNVPLDELLSSIVLQFPEEAKGIKPLPSWIQDLERYVREPVFLDDALPELEQTDRSNIQTTLMSHPGELESQPGAIETTPIPETLPPAVEWRPSDAPVPPDDAPIAEFSADEEIEQEQAFAQPPDEVSEPEPPVPQATPGSEVEMEEELSPITQLALSLTQASLELTADATLLARGGEIVAFAGNMPLEDIEALRAGIDDDWEAGPDEARIRFVTLPDSGQDFMLYSRRTQGGFTLSMIFTASTPLRVIRRQSDRLVDALYAIPDITPEEEPSLLDDLKAQEELRKLEEQAMVQEEAARESTAQLQLDQFAVDGEEVESAPTPDIEVSVSEPPPLHSGPLTAQTYLWLVRDANNPLDDKVAQTIQSELSRYLTSQGWGVRDLEVAEDYVYILADVPADTPAQDIVLDLKQRAASIAQKADDARTSQDLWAESYAILTPGREMDTEEIQRYINFARMQ
jgi:DNA-binding response OmpR family regulator/REP element-mobilizing transposase RayT